MTLKAGSEGRASGAIGSSMFGPLEVHQHVCLHYMSRSPRGGFNNVVAIEWLGGEETWQTKLKS
jgi:hypothetical protein